MNKTLMKARKLRHSQTEAEQMLWQHLRNRQLDGYKFKRQFPIEHYIADFACSTKKLIIELDGYHHSEPEQQSYDDVRTQYLQARGYCILRFWNHNITTDLTAVLETVRQVLKAPRPVRERGWGEGKLSLTKPKQ